MLYGMDDDNEFSLIKSPKLNIKKVVIVTAIILLALLVVFFGFFISNKFSKNENKQELGTSNDLNSNKVNIAQKDSVIINKNQNETQESNIETTIPPHNIEVIKTKFLPKYNENAQNIIKDIYGAEEKQVYLTFDDGPSKDITPQILNILKENDVKATFFVLGARVDLYPSVLKREYEEGHYIANHGYSHQYSQIYASKDTVFQEYVECENAIRNALEIPEYNTFLFRFPGGSSGGRYNSVKAEARSWLTANGIAYTNWNCLTGDAEGKKTKEACMREMLNTKGNNNSIILLMHDANDKSQTVETLPELIQYYKNEGYVFKTFEDIFK